MAGNSSLKWGQSAHFSLIGVNTFGPGLVLIGGRIGPIGKVHCCTPADSGQGDKAPIEEVHFAPPRIGGGPQGAALAGQGRRRPRPDCAGRLGRWEQDRGGGDGTVVAGERG